MHELMVPVHGSQMADMLANEAAQKYTEAYVQFASLVCRVMEKWGAGVADLVVQDVSTGIGKVRKQGLLQIAQQDLVGAHLLNQGLPLFLKIRPLMLDHHIQQLLCQPLQVEPERRCPACASTCTPYYIAQMSML